MSLPLIKYPYTAPGKTYKYVAPDNEFMLAAKAAAEGHGCRKHATSAVVVKNGEIVYRASNAGTFVKVCPRVYKDYKTGEGYRFCQEYCGQQGHSEVLIVEQARAEGVDLTGAELYLYGHWWVCQNCWDHLLSAGIEDVYLQKNSEVDFNLEAKHPGFVEPEPELEIYVAGPMTHVKNKEEVFQLYLDIGELGDKHGYTTCVPFRDIEAVVENPTPEYIYDKCAEAVKRADLVIAYVGDTSLGVGMELECANRYNSLVILLSEEGYKVSGMVLGSPSIIDHVQFSSRQDALEKLGKAILKFKESARQQNVSVKL